MKKYSLILLAFILAHSTVLPQVADRSRPPEPGPPPRIQLGTHEFFTLENGLRVIVVENHSLPRVSFRITLDIDPVPEGEKAGYTSVAGELLRAGTARHSKEELDENIDFIGASLSTSATGISASCLSRHTETLLSLMSEILLHPVFPEDELEKTRKQLLSALQSTRDDPGTMAENVAKVLRYGPDNPYGELMTEETVSRITRNDLVQYYQTYFRPNAAYLIVVGDIDSENAHKLAEKYFGSWEPGEVPEHKHEFPPAPGTNRVAFVDKAGAVQSVIQVTYPVKLSPGHPDAIPAAVANSILGGGVFSGRLMQNLRETHAYTYGARSTLNTDKLMGYFSASTSVRNSVTDSALVEILKEMERMRTEPVDDGHLQLVKNVMSGSFARSLEDPQTVARFALNTRLYNLPENYYSTYLEKLEAVTPEQVQEMSRKYILPHNAYLVVAGNRGEVAGKLEKLAGNGMVEFYDAFGKPAEASGELPEGLTAWDVIDRYVEAVGGAERLDQIKNLTIHMSAEVQGMTIEAVSYQKAPNLYAMSMSMNGAPLMKQVFDGKRGAVVAMQQVQELQGDALAQMKAQAVMNPELRYHELGYTAELTGMEKVNGKETYTVKITNPLGLETIDYFSVETGYRLRRVTIVGENSQVNDYGNYREVNGVVYPFEMTTSLGQQTLVMKVQEVDNRSEIDQGVFAID
ncbi:MAG TPA: insulinase family protein [Bacteroidetes bacterium]|nr:insulinase family protein [Bacteroidota bacterium]